MTFTDRLFCGRERFSGINPSLIVEPNFRKIAVSLTIKINPKCEPKWKIPKQDNFLSKPSQQRNPSWKKEPIKFRNLYLRKYPLLQRSKIVIGDLPNDY